MSTVKAKIPENNLATEIGTPNTLSVGYSTEILLPVEGPHFYFKFVIAFTNILMELNEFLMFIDVIAKHAERGTSFGSMLDYSERVPTTRPSKWKYDREMVPIVNKKLYRKAEPQRTNFFLNFFTPSTGRNKEAERAQNEILEWLSKPSRVFRDAYETGLLSQSKNIVSDELLKADFNNRCRIIMEAFLKLYSVDVPNEITATLRQISDLAIKRARSRHPLFMYKEFTHLPDSIRKMIDQWLVARYVSDKDKSKADRAKQLIEVIGFIPFFFIKEWAFRRMERMEMEFGTPDIRGPLKTEAVPPQGSYNHEEYHAVSNELASLAAQSRGQVTREITGTLRQSLNSIYYSGPGTVDELVSQGSALSLSEERRETVLSVLNEISERNETIFTQRTIEDTSTTTAYELEGVDDTRSCTVHRFKVSIPVQTTIFLDDVGITWCPRVLNPFMNLRQTIRNVYEEAVNQYKQQYYVPVPVTPVVAWEKYTVSKDVLIDEGAFWEWETVSTAKNFTINITTSENRHDKPDFNNATVTWNQNGGFFNDDPSTWSIWLSDLSYSPGTITGKIHLETTDGGADFDGTAHVDIPILRWSEATVSAMANFEAQQQDYELKTQAIEAQAHQYARIKEREIIERHERLDQITKIVFEELFRLSCPPIMGANLSYYMEIIKRCIDWNDVTINFESDKMGELLYPAYPPDHFMNSPAVRMFFPIHKSSESLFFDTLEECGTVFVRQSVQDIKDKIGEYRTTLEQNGPETLDVFETQVVIGDHLEPVLSKFEHSD